MKILHIFLATFLFTTHINAQVDFRNHPFPNDYNAFTNSPTISWACGYSREYSFQNILINNKPIYWYLLDGQSSGQIKSYIPTAWISENPFFQNLYKNKLNDFYLEIEKSHRDSLFSNLNFDTLNNINFNEILFIQNHKLKSYIYAASPRVIISTSSGIELGYTDLAYSCINNKPEYDLNKTDSILFLRNTYDSFKLDSLEKITSIKKTYSMDLAFNLWYDLSKGYNKAIDIKRNKIINPEILMDYSIFDSVEVSYLIDSTAPLIRKVPAAPVRYYFSHLGISQDWFYNKTRNVFFSKINEVYLYTTTYINKGKEEINKSIKIIF